tara:strand:- start:393 stop:737 length:345 start_codon:yes stop_codon:yes gene_type:complete
MAKQMTFSEAQAEAMRIGRENNLSDSETETVLRRIMRKNNIPIQKGMAEKQQFDKNKGGMAKKTGPMEMAMGGVANGKKHMYLSKGALVTENLNPGLKALAKKRPDVVRNILKK